MRSQRGSGEATNRATLTRRAAFASSARAAVRTASQKTRFIAGRVILVVLAVAVCLLPALFVNDVIGYLPLIALVLILVISLVYLLILRAVFSFDESSLAASCERGSEIDFVLNFKNSSFLVFCRFEVYIYVSDLFGDVDSVTKVPLTLLPFENKEFHFQAVFDHIGTYSAGVQKIVIYDLLGLFTHTITNKERHCIEVMPRLFEADEVPLSSEASSDSAKPHQTLSIDEMDYAGVRDYEWGDAVKTIHWKLSAREPDGEYLTRMFETYNNPGVAIILDTSAPRYDSESLMFVYDSIVESALSVNEFAKTQGIESYLAFNDKYGESEQMRISGLNDFPELTSVLPRIEPGDGLAARELLRREINTLHGQDNVAFCTAHVNEEVLTLLSSLKVHKRNPLLFLIVPPIMSTEDVDEYMRPLRTLDDAGVPYFVVSAASGLGAEKRPEGEDEEEAGDEVAQMGYVREVGDVTDDADKDEEADREAARAAASAAFEDSAAGFGDAGGGAGAYGAGAAGAARGSAGGGAGAYGSGSSYGGAAAHGSAAGGAAGAYGGAASSNGTGEPVAAGATASSSREREGVSR